ncbi:hypothetical protein [Streptomyces sp. NPDC101150]|uniref:hypothetical protein n=1 Tax=Streptomyces sp. NPDC101150 TaxID=3366114 RepID=UPI003822D834
MTIAAAESVEPERAVADAIHSNGLPVVGFYVLSIFLTPERHPPGHRSAIDR